MKSVIEVEHFTRSYGPLVAVNDISFTVERGSFFGFLGPNGAGKSTTIHTLCTILAKTEGMMRINGHDVDREKNLVRKDIGIVFQDSTLDARLTVSENLGYHCDFYGVARTAVAERIRSALDIMGLSEWSDMPASGLSGGLRRRVEIARALVHFPKVLFLDEPTAGLDPQARAAVWKHLERVRSERGITVFLSTHYMEEAEICSRVAIINRGRLAALGSPLELSEQFTSPVLELETSVPDEMSSYLSGHGIPFEIGDGRFKIRSGSIETEAGILSRFAPSVISYSRRRGSLDDVFLAVADAGSNLAAEGGVA